MIAFDSPRFKEPEAFRNETLRVYEICNGCRRCFNLCPSFDVLFRGIDDKDGEVNALDGPVLNQVVDLCYYCKLCFNHCPYCPPHHYDLDFPRLMIWGKHLKAKQQPAGLRDRLLVDVEFMGRLGGTIAPLANWALRRPFIRRALEKVMGIHRERLFPAFHWQSFSSWFRRTRNSAKGATQAPVITQRAEASERGRLHPALPVEGATQAPMIEEKVALFYTCYVNHHDPEIGKATLQVLEKNGVEVICPEQECCGMPYFDIGDLDAVRQKARSNLKRLAAAVDAGYKIVSPMPTCSLMLKKEYPDLVPTDEARKVAANTFDLCEYLMKLEGKGKLAKDFVSRPGKIAYQVPCHLRDQNIGLKSRDLMKLIPGATVEVIERCSGHDGTFGVKKEYYDLSLKVGRKAFAAVENAEPDVAVSDCPLSGLALTQSTGKKAVHPIQVVQKAYGLK
ncbi:MAG TPA: anaerobic glycerol-3-phosphate dehydrogenase subunit C [Nitrospiria bacterium]|nr:anaerobic glycerol-3-phosphate dehydrogenase subunit C [Nitrospiria bacterium]